MKRTAAANAKLELDKIEEAIDKFLRKSGGKAFSKAEILKSLSAKFKDVKPKDRDAIEREAELCLASREDVLSNPEKGLFQSRDGFFKGALFRVVPTKMELSNGILIAGGRFAVFCAYDVFPESMTLSTKDGWTASIVPFSAPFDQISGLHILLGNAGLMDYLTAESEENYEALNGGGDLHKAMMTFDVFDMREFYKESGFREGDALIFEVKDWDKGAFEFRREPAGTRTDAERGGWISSLEKALIATYDSHNDYIEIPEQLAQAFFKDAQGGGSLLKEPSVGLDEYPKMMKDVAMRSSESDWLIVPLDCLDEPGGKEEGGQGGDGSLSAGDFSVSSGNLDSLESILSDIKSPLHWVELQAMVFDEIANGCESFDEFRKRALEPFKLSFADDAQEATFLNFMEDMWETSADKFSPTVDEPKAPLRTRLLELGSRRMEAFERLFKKAEANPRTLPVGEDVVSELKDCYTAILATLSLLNADASLSEEGEDYENLELRVGDIEEAWDSLMERVDAALLD